MNSLRMIRIKSDAYDLWLNVAHIAFLNQRARMVAMSCGREFTFTGETWEQFMTALRDPNYRAE